jgi:predicted RNase H-like HicB family nuclease
MGMSRNLTAAVHQEEDWYVAQCLEVDVASQGRTIEEALGNLAEAVALYLEEVDDPQQHVTATPLVTSFQVPPPNDHSWQETQGPSSTVGATGFGPAIP